jgi:glutaryl-CoA dehydrogenase
VWRAAQDCLHILVNYSLERQQFDSKLAGFQLVQMNFADMVTEVAPNMGASYRVSRLLDAGDSWPGMISLVKRSNVLKSMDTARKARNILEANGLKDKFGVIRHMVDLEIKNCNGSTGGIHGVIGGNMVTDIIALARDLKFLNIMGGKK